MSAMVQLTCEIDGEGEPLVLIPGFAAGAWIWFEQVNYLSESLRTMTFDPPGIGKSKFSDRPPRMRLLADDIANLLRDLSIDRAHILGASFGGFVAQEFALSYPEMTRTLTVSCTSFGGPNHVMPSMEVLLALASTDDFNTDARVRRNLLPAFSTDFVRDHPHDVEKLIGLRMSNPVDENAYRWQLAAAMAFNAESKLSAIKAPTLVITGDADSVVPPQNSINLAAKIPRSQFVMIKGGSHLFFIERPNEFNSAVAEFLKRN